jgi:ParB-like chromosome segregation protein Spo0J
MQSHELAECFPLIAGNEFAELVASIRARGQHEPITLFNGLILDGRNRYRACLEC